MQDLFKKTQENLEKVYEAREQNFQLRLCFFRLTIVQVKVVLLPLFRNIIHFGRLVWVAKTSYI
jgi:hypothetical protein